jgi:drug/metabolite transporter (DMT)-like permease
MIASLLGFSAALSWGAGDFTSGTISRRIGAIRGTLYVEIIGLILLAGAVLVFPSPTLPLSDWLWCAAGGAIGSLGMVVFNHALTKGPMSSTAPVSALTATALPVVVGIWMNGLPGIATIIGFILAMVSIWLISQTGRNREVIQPKIDLRLPLIAGLGFGLYFICIHEGSTQATLWPMVISRLSGSITLFIFALFTKQMKFPPKPLLGLVLLNTLLDIGGNAFYILAGQFGRMDVAVVLSSLYPGVTVVLGWLVLHETINRWQWTGILAALIAITLLVV